MVISAVKTKKVPVMVVKSGQNLGPVKHIVLEAAKGEIKAFVLKVGGSLGAWRVLLFADVKEFGPDAVMVESAELITSFKEHPEIKELYKKKITLLGNRVITQSGTDMGEVSDFTFTDDGGLIVKVMAVAGFFKKLKGQRAIIDRKQIVTIGRDAIIVKDAALREEEARQRAAGTVEEEDPVAA
jgi:uncharacterized protein YrrD